MGKFHTIFTQKIMRTMTKNEYKNIRGDVMNIDNSIVYLIVNFIRMEEFFLPRKWSKCFIRETTETKLFSFFFPPAIFKKISNQHTKSLTVLEMKTFVISFLRLLVTLLKLMLTIKGQNL